VTGLDELLEALERQQPGETVKLTVLRAGKPAALTVRLGLPDQLQRLEPLVRDVHQLCQRFLTCGVLLRGHFPDKHHEHLDVQSDNLKGVEQ
jgi:hypothetical protein